MCYSSFRRLATDVPSTRRRLLLRSKGNFPYADFVRAVRRYPMNFARSLSLAPIPDSKAKIACSNNGIEKVRMNASLWRERYFFLGSFKGGLY